MGQKRNARNSVHGYCPICGSTATLINQTQDTFYGCSDTQRCGWTDTLLRTNRPETQTVAALKAKVKYLTAEVKRLNEALIYEREQGPDSELMRQVSDLSDFSEQMEMFSKDIANILPNFPYLPVSKDDKLKILNSLLEVLFDYDFIGEEDVA